MNSLMSILMSASSLPNMNSARALASSVLPTPVGPRKTNEPMGRFGSFRPARARRTALETISIASCWPMTRLCRSSSMWRSRWDSSSAMRMTGMPVHIETTWAISSSSTEGCSLEMDDCHSARRSSAFWRAAASASRRVAASSYSCELIALSFSRVIRSRSFWASRRTGGAEA